MPHTYTSRSCNWKHYGFNGAQYSLFGVSTYSVPSRTLLWLTDVYQRRRRTRIVARADPIPFPPGRQPPRRASPSPARLLSHCKSHKPLWTLACKHTKTNNCRRISGRGSSSWAMGAHAEVGVRPGVIHSQHVVRCDGVVNTSWVDRVHSARACVPGLQCPTGCGCESTDGESITWQGARARPTWLGSTWGRQ